MAKQTPHPLIAARLLNTLSSRQETLREKIDELIAENEQMIELLCALAEQPGYELLKAFIKMYEDVNTALEHLDLQECSSLIAVNALANSTKHMGKAIDQIFQIHPVRECRSDCRSHESLTTDFAQALRPL